MLDLFPATRAGAQNEPNETGRMSFTLMRAMVCLSMAGVAGSSAQEEPGPATASTNGLMAVGSDTVKLDEIVIFATKVDFGGEHIIGPAEIEAESPSKTV